MSDEAARRRYWTEQMDEAYDFMQVIMNYPVEECGEAVQSMQAAVADKNVNVAFSNTKIASHERVYFLREGLIDPFLAIALAMNERGWQLKVEDGFRSRAMQRDISLQPVVIDAVLKKTMWELNGAVPDPDFLLKRLSALTATAPKVGTHMSASAIDISIISFNDGTEIDRGGPYLEMSELTPMQSPFIAEQALHNRQEIRALMESYGFMAYPYEFWHFNAGDAYDEYLHQSDKPGRYGAVDIDTASGQIVPIENPQESLHDLENIQQQIDAALLRLKE